MEEMSSWDKADNEITYTHSPIPEGIEEYAGQWVAIRGENIVISSPDFMGVYRSEAYNPADVLYYVPTPGDNYIYSSIN